jgi:hypothetical protein
MKRRSTANDGFRFLYKRDMTALENYQSSTSLRVFFSPYRETYRPACCEAIMEHYAARRAAMGHAQSVH